MSEAYTNGPLSIGIVAPKTSDEGHDSIGGVLSSTDALIQDRPTARHIKSKERDTTRDLGRERVVNHAKFRTVCDELWTEASKFDQYFENGILRDEAMEVIVEIEFLLEALYDVRWGEGESLKEIVVLIQSQILNAKWELAHVSFLKDVVSQLRRRYLIDETVTKFCYDLIRSHGLQEFRGTVREPETRCRYRIVKIEEDAR